MTDVEAQLDLPALSSVHAESFDDLVREISTLLEAVTECTSVKEVKKRVSMIHAKALTNDFTLRGYDQGSVDTKTMMAFVSGDDSLARQMSVQPLFDQKTRLKVCVFRHLSITVVQFPPNHLHKQSLQKLLCQTT